MNKKSRPKPRKHGKLFQAYSLYDEITRMRVRHLNRASAIERGDSAMNLDFEQDVIEYLNPLKERAHEAMIECSKDLGAIWEWVTSIKGLGAGTIAACLLAQIDDIGLFDTVSKLWRFAGLAVIDGKAERNKLGERSHYNCALKTICWQIADSFIKHQTPVYVNIYYTEKERLRRLHPERYKEDGKWKYNDGHIHHMAMRKMMKIFLQHLWLKWREYEGLPTNQPYVQAILGHTNIIKPE